MQVEGVTVTKIIEPQQLGVHNDKIIYICYGKYGEYLQLLDTCMGYKRKVE